MKPICSVCKKTGDDKYYFWTPDKRGKGGQLSHLSCLEGIRKATNNFGRGK